MIHYISQYSESEEYDYSPGGVSKMSYFLYCLKQMGFDTEIFSCVPKKERGFMASRRTISKYGFKLHYVATLKSPNKILNTLNFLMIQLQLFFYLIKIPSSDTVYFYHERFYAPVFKIIRKIKRFRLVCDVEEIYTIAAQYSQPEINREINYLKGFEYYTLAGKGLAELLSLRSDQYAICCGVYSPIINSIERTGHPIKILYAGTFDTTKGGALAAIESARYLNDDYQLLVCGFGSEEQIDRIEKRIEAINLGKKREAIVYLGYVRNSSPEYIEMLNNCAIGLATQNPKGAFNNTSFPSKIFEYMRFGLKVVSTSIKETSNLPVTQSIFFIKDYSPSEIANAIETAEKNKSLHSQSEILNEMHVDFCSNFSRLLTNH